MVKVALLIGVSEYEPGLNPLPAAVKDVAALQRIFQDSEMGDFDEVKALTNPDPQAMQYEIETLFSGRSRDDLVLLFFSGHGIKDDSNNLYFATRITRKNPKGDLIRSTAVPARFIHEVMNNSRAKRQAIILDCCFSGAFDPTLQTKDDGSVDLQGQLGAEGRVVLTSSSSTQYSFEQQGSELSLYTRYLVEGIETGAGDRDEDGKISVRELHDYATSRVQETAPNMTPKLITLKEMGFEIMLAKAKVTDPKLRYRKQVERCTSQGSISSIGRIILDKLQTQLSLSLEVTRGIEAEVLRPYQERLENLQRYRQAFSEAIEHEYPLSRYIQSELEDLREILGLRQEDVNSFEQETLAQTAQRSEAEQGVYQRNLQRYEQEFRRAIEAEYPFSDSDRTGLQRLQQLLSLRDEDIAAIEAPVLAYKQIEAERRRVERLQQEQETKRLQQEQAKAIEAERQRVERLQQEQEAKRLQQEQAKAAERQRVERQRQEAERLQQQQVKAQPENTRSTVSPQPGRSIPRPPQPLRQPEQAPTITRQQFLKLAGFGGGALTIALLGNQVSQNQKTPENSAPPQRLTGDFETVTVDDKGQIIKRTPAKAEFFKEDLGNGVALDMVAIPAGEFLMGTADTERDTIIQELTRYGFSQEDAEGRTGRELPQHRVKLPTFWMGRFAVTQAQWSQVAGLPKAKIDLKANPSNFKGAKRPVETVSWEEAVEFCDRLSQKTGNSYRLPSEAEWEYACRAGTTTPFYFGETITSDLVNCNGNYPHGNAPKGEYRQQTTEVGAFPPNGFGLSDMHGNVWEWCADPWHDNYQDAPTDGSVWTTNGNNEIRVIRGGSWSSYPVYCRSAYRGIGYPRATDYFIGFRIVCSSPRTLV